MNYKWDLGGIPLDTLLSQHLDNLHVGLLWFKLPNVQGHTVLVIASAEHDLILVGFIFGTAKCTPCWIISCGLGENILWL